jgi:NTE family protein
MKRTAWRGRPLAGLVLLAGLLGGCAKTIDDTPINVVAATTAVPASSTEFLPVDDLPDVSIGLSFSGGGTRAAAFAFGVMQELDRLRLPGDPAERSLLDAVDIVSGVSGGSVPAAYFGLKGHAALADFRYKFLIQDAEASFSTAIDLTNILTLVDRGGANSAHGLADWLDRQLFHGATYADLRRRNLPTLWINATDLYNRIPFSFTEETFSALCTDLKRVRLADAVSASAAFPVAFAPVNVEAFPRDCAYRLPSWASRAAADNSGSALARAVASGLERYRDPGVIRYVKLADGGITDNFGIQGIALAREIEDNPYRPLTPQIAVRLRRALFLVVNAGRAPAGKWALKKAGPDGFTTIGAVADAATESSARSGYDTFRLVVDRWHDDLVRWRCGLPSAEISRLRGSTVGWNCRDLQMFVGEVAFIDAGADRQPRLEQVPTRFRLPTDMVDYVIESGRIALRNEPTVRQFIESLRRPRTPAIVSR